MYNEDLDMTTQQFNELKSKLTNLTDSQLKSLQGEINLTLNQKRESLLSTEEREMLSQLFSQTDWFDKQTSFKQIVLVITLPS